VKKCKKFADVTAGMLALFSQIPCLFYCKPRLKMFFFSSFRADYDQGRLTFFSLAYRKVEMALTHSLATSPN